MSDDDRSVMTAGIWLRFSECEVEIPCGPLEFSWKSLAGGPTTEDARWAKGKVGMFLHSESSYRDVMRNPLMMGSGLEHPAGSPACLYIGRPLRMYSLMTTFTRAINYLALAKVYLELSLFPGMDDTARPIESREYTKNSLCWPIHVCMTRHVPLVWDYPDVHRFI